MTSGGHRGALLHVFVAGRPIAQGSMRTLARGRMTHDNPKLRTWRKAVAWAARSALGPAAPTDDAVLVRCVFAVRPQRSNDAPDLDKLIRAVLDALTGIAYTDDKQVVVIDARRVMLWEDTNPEGLQLTVEHA